MTSDEPARDPASSRAPPRGDARRAVAPGGAGTPTGAGTGGPVAAPAGRPCTGRARRAGDGRATGARASAGTVAPEVPLRAEMADLARVEPGLGARPRAVRRIPGSERRRSAAGPARGPCVPAVRRSRPDGTCGGRTVPRARRVARGRHGGRHRCGRPRHPCRRARAAGPGRLGAARARACRLGVAGGGTEELRAIGDRHRGGRQRPGAGRAAGHRGAHAGTRHRRRGHHLRRRWWVASCGSWRSPTSASARRSTPRPRSRSSRSTGTAGASCRRSRGTCWWRPPAAPVGTVARGATGGRGATRRDTDLSGPRAGRRCASRPGRARAGGAPRGPRGAGAPRRRHVPAAAGSSRRPDPDGSPRRRIVPLLRPGAAWVTCRRDPEPMTPAHPGPSGSGRPPPPRPARWARRWRLVAHAGDRIALLGPLGAGKTQLAKGFAAGLGVRDEVTSPSFTLMAEYAGRLPLFHLDLYRLAGRRGGVRGRPARRARGRGRDAHRVGRPAGRDARPDRPASAPPRRRRGRRCDLGAPAADGRQDPDEPRDGRRTARRARLRALSVGGRADGHGRRPARCRG